MTWVCPLCGHDNDEEAGTCICGYQHEESAELNSSGDSLLSERQKGEGSAHVMDRPIRESQKVSKKIKVRAPEKPAAKTAKPAKKPVKPSNGSLIKEIDGWEFAYSEAEKCLYLGTPALQSFKLKLAIEDIKEILDIMYERSGIEKTTRKLQLSDEEVLDLVSVLDGMIEEKRAKVKLTYSTEDISAIAHMINRKLKD